MPLSATNVVQAKTGTKAADISVDVTLDNPTQAGGTVIVEMYGPIVWPGMPAGWEFDVHAGSQLWVFRRSGIPAGESSWNWTLAAGSNNWLWRVTEWDTVMDPVGPLEVTANNTASGSGVTTLSTGTTGTSNRAEVVALAAHVWAFATADTSRTVSFGSHTGGFTERAEQRFSGTNYELDGSWSWLFQQATGTFETTATVSNSAPNAGDTYYSTMAVYAAPVDPYLNPRGSVVMG